MNRIKTKCNYRKATTDDNQNQQEKLLDRGPVLQPTGHALSMPAPVCLKQGPR